MKPDQIEKESFRIILDELGPHSFSSSELAIVQRVIHATADFDYKNLLHISAKAIENGIQAIRSGCNFYCDVQMIAAGVSQALMTSYGCGIDCKVSDPQVVSIASQQQKTRSEVAMQQFGPKLNDSIVTIGNAPTALFEVLRLFESEQIKPALVIGVPVGFVNAAESKQALTLAGLDFITTTGRKGGSTVAVAIVNALLRLAGGTL